MSSRAGRRARDARAGSCVTELSQGLIRTSICSHYGKTRISHQACNHRNSHSTHNRTVIHWSVHSTHQIAVHTFAAGPSPGDESTNTFLDPCQNPRSPVGCRLNESRSTDQVGCDPTMPQPHPPFLQQRRRHNSVHVPTN